MSKRILVETRDGIRSVALMEDKRLLHFSREMPGKAEAEQIYLGIVDRIVKGMEAAFVRLTRDQMGFLPFSECLNPPRSGDVCLLQVKKPAVGGKAPYVTQRLALAGRLAILTPRDGQGAVSKRVEDEALRKRLMETAVRLAPPGMGLILRSESQDAPEDEIRREVDALRAEWEQALSQARSSRAPCLIRDRQDPVSRLIRDEQGVVDEIWADDPAALPPLPLPVRACPNPFQLFGVEDKWKKSMQRKVWLDCGGSLIIDRTEALTVIDVNSGKYTGGKSGAESTFLRLNREAAVEIARLLRLRGLGGIILIDFVDMQSQESRDAVLEEMRAALRQDPVKTVVHGFTSLGLMEVTRKKTESPGPAAPCPPEENEQQEE